MAQTIKLKRSSVSGNTPGTSDLELGEVAINTYDGKMFIKKNDGSDSIVEIGGTSGTVTEAFKTIAAGGNSIVADSPTDTVSLVAGSNVTISSAPVNDTITISASTSGDANQNAFTNVAATGQNTLQAASTTDTVTFNSADDTTMDNRYAEDRDKVTLTTDTSTKKLNLKNGLSVSFLFLRN